MKTGIGRSKQKQKIAWDVRKKKDECEMEGSGKFCMRSSIWHGTLKMIRRSLEAEGSGAR